jgi:hypothetical protein
VFLAADSDQSIEYFTGLPGFEMYTIKGYSRSMFCANDTVREMAGDIGSLYAWADIHGLALGSIVVGTYGSNIIRMVMEMRAVQYEMASNWMIEVGRTSCVSMAHCERHGMKWKFDWDMGRGIPWGEFQLDSVWGSAKGEELTV